MSCRMWPAVHWVQIIYVLEMLDPDLIRNPGVGSATFFRKRLANTGGYRVKDCS
jgi:hypothetical protein